MLTTTARRLYAPPVRGANLSVATMRHRERIKLAVLVAALAVATAVGLYLIPTPRDLLLLVAAIVVPAILVWLWQHPVTGVYVLFTGTVLLESTGSAQSFWDDIGGYVPFFEDLATWTHVKGLSFSLAEIFMALVLLTFVFKGLAERRFRFDKGSLMLPLGLYMLMVVAGELHGLGTGGDFKLSLWEVRAQAYMFIAYILICNLVKTRRQISVLTAILMVGTGLRGIQGIIRYFVELHGNLHGLVSLFSHEQSYFFNLYIVFTAILYLYGGPRGLKRMALALLPFVVVANLANDRRTAVLALGLALVAMLIITVVIHPPRRRLTLAIILLAVIIWEPYYQIYKTKSGLIAQPAAAVYSNSHPDPRDASSNLYRVNEDADIIATMKSSTLSKVIGYGFGKYMLTPLPLADISTSYIFWNLLPHNSILWIWMRMGTIGYLIFWTLIAAAIIQATRVARRLDDPFLKGLAVLIVTAVMQEVIFGYLDLQWTNDRNLITMGVLLALISRLALFARPDDDAPKRWGTQSGGEQHHTRRSIESAETLVVVDGRLKRERPAPVGARA